MPIKNTMSPTHAKAVDKSDCETIEALHKAITCQPFSIVLEITSCLIPPTVY